MWEDPAWTDHSLDTCSTCTSFPAGPGEAASSEAAGGHNRSSSCQSGAGRAGGPEASACPSGLSTQSGCTCEHDRKHVSGSRPTISPALLCPSTGGGGQSQRRPPSNGDEARYTSTFPWEWGWGVARDMFIFHWGHHDCSTSEWPLPVGLLQQPGQLGEGLGQERRSHRERDGMLEGLTHFLHPLHRVPAVTWNHHRQNPSEESQRRPRAVLVSSSEADHLVT